MRIDTSIAKYSITVRINMMAILTASRTIFSGSWKIISNEGDFLKIIVDSKENISKTVADMMAERLTLKPESDIAG